MPQQFDPNRPGEIQGEITSVLVADPVLAPNAPNHVLDPTKDFTITVTWRLEGPDVPLWLAGLAPADWSVAAYAESMGPGPEVILAEETEPRLNFTDLGGFVKEWTHTLNVPAGSLAEENPGPAGPSGVYKIVATVFLNSNLGIPGFDMAGFSEGPIVKVENPV
jgi:hypothetical protein